MVCEQKFKFSPSIWPVKIVLLPQSAKNDKKYLQFRQTGVNNIPGSRKMQYKTSMLTIHF